MENKIKSGISLIVLVITILVLAILAATVIISISNTNVISETNQTTFKQDMASYKEAYELAANKLAENAEFDRSSHNVTSVSDEYEKIFGSVPDKYKDGLKVAKGKLVYVTTDETEKAVLEEIAIASSTTGTTPSTPTNVIGTETETVNGETRSKYIGYYADVDGDGTVDGVIFADLAHTVTEKQWPNSNGAFEYNAVSGLKNYEISQASYSVTGATGYGSKPVLKATGSGEDRFYVMSLSNFTISGYTDFYWYTTLFGIDNTSRTADTFGSGKQNTVKMISDWTADTNSSKNARDMWGVIKQKVYGLSSASDSITGKEVSDVEWFVPSKAEWVAFGYALRLTSSNYGSYGLSDYYWSSSIGNSFGAWCAHFGRDDMLIGYFDSSTSVRLATTF